MKCIVGQNFKRHLAKEGGKNQHAENIKGKFLDFENDLEEDN